MPQAPYYSYGTFCGLLFIPAHPVLPSLRGCQVTRAIKFRFILVRCARRSSSRDACTRGLKFSEEEFTMRNKLGGICLLTALVVSSFATPLFAGNAKAFKRTVVAPRYEASKEVTMEGTIQGLVRKPAPGTMMGAHLTVSTSKGTIDAHIGDFILRGSHAYAPAAGQ